MFVGRNFSLKVFLRWTSRALLAFVLWAVLVTALYDIFHLTWLGIPWLPISLLGTAVAFLVSFKNNASYGRLWEARKIWGGIVNDSRSWGIMARDYVTNAHARKPRTEAELAEIHRRLIYRRIAFVTALRYQLREPRSWENMASAHNVEYRNRTYTVPEYANDLPEQLSRFLSPRECDYVLGKSNPAVHILSLQSEDLRHLLDEGLIEDFRHMEMMSLITQLYTNQGKAERIKNFPYPRQFATLNLFFVGTFIFLVPFGLLNEFEKLGGHLIWLNVVASVLVSWVFFSMEKVGESSECPFEGSANDIPMFALSRTIEIDLRQMLDESDVPPPIKPINDVLL